MYVESPTELDCSYPISSEGNHPLYLLISIFDISS